MNNPSPFAPQSSAPEQKHSNRSRVRWYVFGILSVHVVGLVALLMIGCRKPQTEENIPAPDTNNIFADASLTTPSNIDTTVPSNAAPTVATSNPPPVVEPTPPPAPVTPEVPPAAGQEYTIVKGDTFATIKNKFPGVTTKMIQDANPNVQPTKLKIGQKLKIPAKAPAPAESLPAPVQPLPPATPAPAVTPTTNF
ncbi:MAG TPA: LysM domain-containing protein [Candidatus Paceibacterota bacterium]|nr:LysM domain-containing protein [Candidatus Paceibacterota bacterium]